uniref:Uncharacterized protein n=1 Tax=Anguilla anguilla TaxID=7936 RepID=A0A0E9VM74_ANGAN
MTHEPLKPYHCTRLPRNK